MRITDMLRQDFLSLSLQAQDKEEVLSELCSLLSSKINFDHDAMVKVLIEREKLGTAGIGDGIAIPHGKLKDLEDTYVAFSRSQKGIPFDSMDGKPVHLFFLLLAPEKSTGQHLKTLAKLARMFKDKNFRTCLMDAQTSNELYRIISEKDDAC